MDPKKLEEAIDLAVVGHALGRWSRLLNELAVKATHHEYMFEHRFSREDVDLLERLITFARVQHAEIVLPGITEASDAQA